MRQPQQNKRGHCELLFPLRLSPVLLYPEPITFGTDGDQSPVFTTLHGDGNFMYVHLMIIIILRLLYHYNLAIRFDFHSVQYHSPGTRLMRERRFTSPELRCSCLSPTPSYGRLQTSKFLFPTLTI